MPCPFYCLRNFTLVLQSRACDPSGQDLTLVINKFEQEVGILVINETNLLHTETTFLAPPPVVRVTEVVRPV